MGSKKSNKSEKANNKEKVEELKDDVVVEEQEQVEVEEEISAEEQLKQELEEAKDKHLRLYSEFENFRRRTAKEKLELVTTANEGLVIDLLPVLDDFERAQSASDKKDMDGFKLIMNKFKKVLEQKGLKVMDTKQGSTFDADLHEAITQIPAPKDKLKGKIMDTIEKGYYLGDKVVRFAKVVIGS